jgi:ribulose-bisphosphate carboxylase large chain
MTARIDAIYRVRSTPDAIEARARAIAIEQSVEMPLEAISQTEILQDIVGEVRDIRDLHDGTFEVRIGLAAATVGNDAGQLMNMLFGNTSLQEDTILHDVDLPPELAAGFGGPAHGIAGLRQLAGAHGRALTGSALKPQGLPPHQLAELAERFALGGVDFIKDDHGLADQAFSAFARRVPLCAAAITKAHRVTGKQTQYIPSLSGTLETMRRQAGIACNEGLRCVMLAPMVAGFATARALISEFPGLAFLAHPSLGGAVRIAPALLIGKLFRLIGADAVVFPNYGGRFGYTPEICRNVAENARNAWLGLMPSLPVPAGGMTTERVPELLDFYGSDAMLLIGGNLLMARENLTAATAAFAQIVEQHRTQ